MAAPTIATARPGSTRPSAASPPRHSVDRRVATRGASYPRAKTEACVEEDFPRALVHHVRLGDDPAPKSDASGVRNTEIRRVGSSSSSAWRTERVCKRLARARIHQSSPEPRGLLVQIPWASGSGPRPGARPQAGQARAATGRPPRASQPPSSVIPQQVIDRDQAPLLLVPRPTRPPRTAVDSSRTGRGAARYARHVEAGHVAHGSHDYLRLA